jgi:dolichyl-phosphate-mannose-protein mannosyltransferase
MDTTPASGTTSDLTGPASGPVDGAPTSIPRLLLERLRESLSDPTQVLAIVLVAAFATRVIWLDMPRGSLIFDEAYYVNAARTILGWVVPAGGHYADAVAGLDPNSEHPPLGKLLMALSMLVFGDNGIGWRLPSLIAGMTALGTLYLIVRAAGESAWLGVLAVGFFAFDNLSLVHGRIGTLDMMVLAFVLLGAWSALRSRWLLAGVFVGLGMLVKLTALYGLLALLILLALALWQTWRTKRRIAWSDLRPTVAMLGAFALVTFAGLWLLDLRFTTYTNPLDHLRHMVEYGTNLKSSAGKPGTCPGIDSAPWQWLVNDCEINYLRVNVNVMSGGEIIASRATVDFRGALNPILAGAAPLAFLFTGWVAWRRRSRLAVWAIVWAAANFLPYVALALLAHRVTYIYYLLPVVPAVAVAVAILLMRARLPRFVLFGFIALYLAGFVAYFPFRQIP